MKKIEPDDFEQWLAHPVTEEVFRALDKLSEQAKQKWLDMSWKSGNADPMMLADLKARAEVIDDLRNLKLEDLENMKDAE